MALPHSPRLPGVKVLASDATGPEYSRWRRGIQTAFEAKGTWGHCDGSNPMPMPERGSTFFSPSLTLQPQVELLDERRAWVKKDRDVKLDLFLSVADDVKFEVFDVGPPLPPSSLNAKEMLDVLDEHFAVFKFEDYHHAFCHFLNLHIDQYPSPEDFNAEFLATLEDLLDHGQSLTNIQACSAYFSKLRCTQNPWVVKKLEEWDAQTSEPQLTNLMKEASSWFNVRPLTTRGSQHSFPTSIPEEDLVELPALSDGEETEVAELAGSMSDSSHSRQSSRSTTRSQEITIAASTEDLSEVAAFPDLYSLTPQKSVPKISLSPVPMIERPLPPLPPGVNGLEIDMRPLKPATSPSPKPRAQQHVAEQLQHPALRSRTPPQPTKPSAKAGTVDHSPITLPSSRFSWGTNTTKTSDSQPRTPRHPPHARTTSSSTTASSFRQPRPKTPSPPQTQTAFPISTPPSKIIPPAELPTADRPHTSHSTKDSNPLLSRPGFTRTKSTSSSVISLPLQGTITPDIDYRDARLKDASYRDVSPISSGSRSRSPPFIRRGTAGSDTIDEERKKMGKKGWNVKAVFNRVN